jgi:nucleoside-diphosphate-sugar epimerase
MKIFIVGASGYIGGSVAAAFVKQGHAVSGLARSDQTAAALQQRGIAPVQGALDDAAALGSAAKAADVTIGAANADHRGVAEAVVKALTGTGKTFLHTSGSSIVGTPARGELVAAVFDEDTPFTPPPARKGRVDIDNMVRGAAGMRGVVIAPSLIYGIGHGANPDSVQVPWLIALAKKAGVAKHIGSGENRWANVHIDDLVPLYLAAIEKAPPGAFYFAENGENSMREMCEAIGRMLGQGGKTRSMSIAEAAAEWGEGAAENTMGSNSRVRAKRARAELGWKPSARPLIEEIERGCYADSKAHGGKPKAHH